MINPKKTGHFHTSVTAWMDNCDITFYFASSVSITNTREVGKI